MNNLGKEPMSAKIGKMLSFAFEDITSFSIRPLRLLTLLGKHRLFAMGNKRTNPFINWYCRRIHRENISGGKTPSQISCRTIFYQKGVRYEFTIKQY